MKHASPSGRMHLTGLVFFFCCCNFFFFFRQVSERQEVAAAQETPSGAGPEARMARLLGLSQRDDAALLSVRFSRGTSRGSCSQALDHRRWCHHAAHTRTSQERFHLLSEHGLWRRLPLSGEKLLADAAHFGLVINASLNSESK